MQPEILEGSFSLVYKIKTEILLQNWKNPPDPLDENLPWH